jgi:hypothetical protein
MDYSEGAPRRDLGDGRSIWLYPQIYNYKIAIGPSDTPWYDDDW